MHFFMFFGSPLFSSGWEVARRHRFCQIRGQQLPCSGIGPADVLHCPHHSEEFAQVCYSTDLHRLDGVWMRPAKWKTGGTSPDDTESRHKSLNCSKCTMLKSKCECCSKKLYLDWMNFLRESSRLWLSDTHNDRKKLISVSSRLVKRPRQNSSGAQTTCF